MKLKVMAVVASSVLLSAGLAAAQDYRTGTVAKLESDSGSINFRVWINTTSTNLCGNNPAASSSAYVENTADWFEDHRTLLVSAYLAGREVQFLLSDTGSSCRIDKVRMQ